MFKNLNYECSDSRIVAGFTSKNFKLVMISSKGFD